MISEVYSESCSFCHYMGCREEHHKIGRHWLELKKCQWCGSVISKALN